MSDFAAALDALYRGDDRELARLLADDPALVGVRSESDQGHYSGYFHQATLLHHVAGNPTIRALPAATVELARLLLDAGAPVDAATRAGPSQPGDIGWSTLGLVATGLDARLAGLQRPLLELLVAHGADLDFRDGGPLVGAVYYGEVEAARFLIECGARCDLVSAAGVGRVDLMAPFVVDGRLANDAHVLAHYSLVRARPSTPHDILGLALSLAARNGQREAAAWLIDRGADPSARPPFDHRATPLHWAALHGHDDVASLLVERGADRAVRDESFHASPDGWARHGGHAALAAKLAS